MKDMLKFLLENVKNVVFLICIIGAVLAFGVRLYEVPSRLDLDEQAIRTLQTKQDMVELRFNTLEQEFATMREDIKEIRSDVKLLLRTK